MHDPVNKHSDGHIGSRGEGREEVRKQELEVMMDDVLKSTNAGKQLKVVTAAYVQYDISCW